MTIHERHHMSHSQHANLMAVGFWLAAIILLTVAAWSGNGWAGVTGVLFVLGGAFAAHEADRS